MTAEGREAAAALLRSLYPRLARMARELVPPGDAEDVLHDSLIEVLSRYPDFVGIKYPLGYTKVVLLRLISRRRLRLPSPPISPAMMERLEQHSEGHPVEDVVLSRIEVEEALDRLPPRQRACVYLYYIEGLKDHEIASVLACRRSTERSQLARGIHQRRRIKPQGLSGKD